MAGKLGWREAATRQSVLLGRDIIDAQELSEEGAMMR